MKIIYILYFLVLISCNGNKSDIDNAHILLKNQKNKYLLKFDSVLAKNISRNQIINDKYVFAWIGQFKLEIFQRQCFDSAQSTEKDLSFPMILDQKISILIKNNKTNIMIPSKKQIQKTISNNKYYVVENKIINIGIVDIQSDTLIIVNGFGGCNSCSEFSGLYNLHGDYIETIYSVKHDKTIRTINNKYAYKYDFIEIINGNYYKFLIDTVNH